MDNNPGKHNKPATWKNLAIIVVAFFVIAVLLTVVVSISFRCKFDKGQLSLVATGLAVVIGGIFFIVAKLLSPAKDKTPAAQPESKHPNGPDTDAEK